MAFDVYPQPPTTPLSIAPGPLGVTTSLVQERRSAETNPTMYIRVAIIGSAVAPSFLLQAGAGDPVVVPSTSGIWDQPGGAGNGAYVADSFLTPEANGVYLIRIFLYLTTASSWKLTIVNNDAVARDFTFVVADSNGDTRQPWIDMSTTIAFNALTSESGPLNLRISNKGTGPLTGLGGAPTGPDAASFTFTSPGTPVNPNGFVDVPVTLQAINTPKIASATLTVTSNDTVAQTTAGHNHQVALSATVGQLEIGFMLDASGSMAFGPNGEHFIGIDNQATRWGKLESGAAAALTMLKNFANGKGNFAVGVYPDITLFFPADPTAPYAGPFPVPSPSANDLEAPGPINAANIEDAIGKLNGHFPREGGAATPIGAGIAHAIGITAFSFGYFAPTNLDLNRRWLILMTDGNQNSGPDPSEVDGGAVGFVAKKIRVMTLGYGNTTAPFKPVNTTLLKTIANAGYQGSDANYRLAQADATPDLTVNFIKGQLFAGLTLDIIADPSGVLTTANPTVSQQMSVTPYDQKLSFIVAWTTYDAERLQVQVRTPLGELLEDSSPAYTVDINPRFRMLTFDRDFLRNAADPTKPRYGTWTLIIRLNSDIIEPPGVAATEDSEPYDYQVLVDSRLQLRTQLDRTSYAVGDAVRLSALLTLDGQGIPNAAVTLSRALPGAAHLNWLASSAVTIEEYNRVAIEQKNNPDIDSLGIKKIALGNKGQHFTPVSNSDVVNMVDAEGIGVYVAETSSTSVPGTYPFLVTAIGTLPDGTLFRREQSVNIELAVRPDLASSVFQVTYAQIDQEGQTLTQAIMTVRPLDRFRNVVLIDPRFDPSLLFSTSGGTFQGPIVDNHDGSYSRTLVYPGGQAPTVSVTVGGNNVVPEGPLVDISDLHFVERLISFDLGREATPGANMHHDPIECLHNFTTETDLDFVSLGGGGSLVVGFFDHHVVGQGDDDITVFVYPDEQPRPYSIEVRHGEEDDWHEIGQSSGVTQSFSLLNHGVETATAIRILDRSWRLRNQDGTPSASPGVSILGIGAKRLEHDHGHHDDR